MNDEAHAWTDDEIARIERELTLQYSEATAEMLQKQDKFLKEYEIEKARYDKDLKAGRITQTQYESFMRDSALQRQWYNAMIDSLTDGAVNADVRAMDTINNATPRIYAENYNYAGYQVENGLQIDTRFTLVNENAVRHLIKDNPDLLPQKEIDVLKDTYWNKQKFTSAILQGIIQGESIPDMANRIKSVMQMNERAAYRNARTACTAAENAGRLQSFLRMREKGIDVKKGWKATRDHRTRSTHRKEDGNEVELEEAFPETGLLYPGDPSTNDPGEVMNCRCRLVARFGFLDYEGEDAVQTFSRLGNQSYADWKKSKPNSKGAKNGRRK